MNGWPFGDIVHGHDSDDQQGLFRILAIQLTDTGRVLLFNPLVGKIDQHQSCQYLEQHQPFLFGQSFLNQAGDSYSLMMAVTGLSNRCLKTDTQTLRFQGLNGKPFHGMN